MNHNRRWGFLLGAFWELARFALLLFAGLTLVIPLRAPVIYVFIVWTSSVTLAIVTAYIALGLFPARYGVYLHVLRAAKLFSLLPGAAVLVLLARQKSALPSLADLTYMQLAIGNEEAPANPFQSLRLALVLAVLAIDVIFLLYLLLWGGGKRKQEKPQPGTADVLPKAADVMPEEK